MSMLVLVGHNHCYVTDVTQLLGESKGKEKASGYYICSIHPDGKTALLLLYQSSRKNPEGEFYAKQYP